MQDLERRQGIDFPRTHGFEAQAPVLRFSLPPDSLPCFFPRASVEHTSGASQGQLREGR